MDSDILIAIAIGIGVANLIAGWIHYHGGHDAEADNKVNRFYHWLVFWNR